MNFYKVSWEELEKDWNLQEKKI